MIRNFILFLFNNQKNKINIQTLNIKIKLKYMSQRNNLIDDGKKKEIAREEEEVCQKRQSDCFIVLSIVSGLLNPWEDQRKNRYIYAKINNTRVYKYFSSNIISPAPIQLNIDHHQHISIFIPLNFKNIIQQQQDGNGIEINLNKNAKEKH